MRTHPHGKGNFRGSLLAQASAVLLALVQTTGTPTQAAALPVFLAPIVGPVPTTASACSPDLYIQYRSYETTRMKVGFGGYTNTNYRFLAQVCTDVAGPTNYICPQTPNAETTNDAGDDITNTFSIFALANGSVDFQQGMLFIVLLR